MSPSTSTTDRDFRIGAAFVTTLIGVLLIVVAGLPVPTERAARVVPAAPATPTVTVTAPAPPPVTTTVTAPTEEPMEPSAEQAPTVDNHYVPVPVPIHHDDHHKSRFCRRHWYC